MALRVGDYRIALDTKDSSANLNFVSHAHSDHTAGVRKKSRILCSEITRDLVETRTGYQLDLAECPDRVSMFNSGHMLGSRQLYVESDTGNSIVYTGDYQMQRSPAAEPIEVRHADIVIMDSTYPFVNVTFDEREEVITSIQRYVQDRSRVGSVLFGAYAMGKAQEIIRICNEIGIAPLVDLGIEKMCRVYSKHGMRLDYTARDLTSGVEEGDFGSEVWIVSMHTLDRVRRHVSELNNRIFTAVATGFARTRRFGTDVQFALSDHADFPQALDYVEQCSPKRIYTCGSGSETFAKNLRSHGYDASSIKLTSDVTSLLANYIKE